MEMEFVELVNKLCNASYFSAIGNRRECRISIEEAKDIARASSEKWKLIRRVIDLILEESFIEECKTDNDKLLITRKSLSELNKVL